MMIDTSPSPSPIVAPFPSPRHEYLVLASGEDQHLHLFQYDAVVTLQWRWLGHFKDTRRLTTVAFSPDGSFLAFGGESGVLRVWHMLAGRMVLKVPYLGPIQDLAWADARTLTVASGSSLFLEELRPRRQPRREIDHLGNETSLIGRIACSSTRAIALARESGVVQVTELAFPEHVVHSFSLGDVPTALAWDPTGQFLAASTSLLTFIFDLNAASPHAMIDAKGVRGLAWAPSPLVALCTRTHWATYALHARLGDVLHPLITHHDPLQPAFEAIAWSPSGDQLAVTSAFGTTLYDAVTGASLARLPAAADGPLALARTPHEPAPLPRHAR